MTRLWLLTALVPVIYLGAVSRASTAVRTQPKLALASDPERFAQLVAASGGVGRARRGLALDAVFIAMVAGVWAPVLGDWWGLAAGAAVIDTAEDVLLLRALAAPPTAPQLRRLGWVSRTKYVAYAAAAVGLAVRVVTW